MRWSILPLWRLSSLLLGALPVFGQELHVSSVTGHPGTETTLEISFSRPARIIPLALKWEITFPAEVLNDEGGGPKAGHAATDSGKSLTCAKRKAYSYVCILAGGQKPVPSGALAILHFKIRADAKTGTAIVRVERAEAVTADVNKLTLKDAEGTVTIR
jgi:hypothetical protein